MKRTVQILHSTRVLFVALAIIAAMIMVAPPHVRAQQTPTLPQPVVAIHFSGLTQALETMPVGASRPTGQGTTGYEWWVTAWHYFVGPEFSGRGASLSRHTLC